MSHASVVSAIIVLGRGAQCHAHTLQPIGGVQYPGLRPRLGYGLGGQAPSPYPTPLPWSASWDALAKGRLQISIL